MSAAAGAAPETSLARRSLGGFFLSGLLLSCLGAVLPAWGHHLTFEHAWVGHYFLALALGILASSAVARRLIAWKGTGYALAIACLAGFCGLAWLSASSPPVAPGWRLGGLFLVGLSAGTMNRGIFLAIRPVYQQDPAATVNLAGIFFGLGCLVSALLVAGTFYVYTVGSIVFLMALIPAFFANLYLRSPVLSAVPQEAEPPRPVREDIRRPVVILLALLLFFQFGNEWALAGWLALFLAHRLGVSPASALLLLAFYWVALLVGRVAAQAILPRVSHAKLLIFSALSAWFGCLVLSLTNNIFGATIGILCIGIGFASVFPLTVEKIGLRFPGDSPAYFKGVFALAIGGGLLAPASLGYFADLLGISVIMGLPLLGTTVVFFLLLVLWLEAKVSGAGAAATLRGRDESMM